MQIYHNHPKVEDRVAMLITLYLACLRSLRASR